MTIPLERKALKGIVFLRLVLQEFLLFVPEWLG